MVSYTVTPRRRGLGAESLVYVDLGDVVLTKIYVLAVTYKGQHEIKETIYRLSLMKRCLRALLLWSPMKSSGLAQYDFVVVGRDLSLRCVGYTIRIKYGSTVFALCDSPSTACLLYERVLEWEPEAVMFVTPAKLPCAKPVTYTLKRVPHPVEWLRGARLYIYSVGQKQVG